MRAQRRPGSFRGCRVLRPAHLFEARHEILVAVQARPAEVMARSRLPELPDRRFDRVRSPWLPEPQATTLVELSLDQSPRRGRGDRRDKVGVGLAAGFDQSQRIALSLHVGEHLVVLVDQPRAAGLDFNAAEDPAWARRTGTPETTFNVFFMRRPRTTLGREAFRLVQGTHQPLELVGQEVPDRSDVKNGRRALVRACPAHRGARQSCPSGRRTP